MSTIKAFQIKNRHISAEILNYGGIISQLNIPGKDGKSRNVVLHFNNLEQYIDNPFYLGGIIGRYANRMGQATLPLENKTYPLTANEGVNQLHGGLKGFNRVYWDVEQLSDAKLRLTYTSKHLEEGYPGNLQVTVDYEVSDHELQIMYQAHTDQITVLNLTNHAYFNLDNDTDKLVFDNYLKINSVNVVKANDNMIPTGEIIDISGTALDFSKGKTIGPDIQSKNDLLANTNGYDHCYAYEGSDLKDLATLTSNESGISMRVDSTEPGLQLYTANFLKEPFKPYTAVCLETQHFPDSPHHPSFPSTTLKPSDVFKSQTIYTFSS
jgi:aldose 1-epimerase